MTSNSEHIRATIGTNIKRIRENKNLTQDEVAKSAKISTNYYAKIERGEVSTSPEKLHRIMKALKVDASAIFPS
ncbi:MAG: helix-turn-helix domain-containing protein [bacterium]|nr:helix-turn-helix domain-containing protein [bacterium]